MISMTVHSLLRTNTQVGVHFFYNACVITCSNHFDFLSITAYRSIMMLMKSHDVNILLQIINSTYFFSGLIRANEYSIYEGAMKKPEKENSLL